ncbi:pantothenate kinase 4-like [Cyclospora cayetanensis]|uniref:Pantothenate kinase 4-like n=1 Tax=Cyclospora cayetanensis TaxID=88456 RepID=A0A6P6RUP1_9EIME|nr:pantothenate kinase 4-like [Cyclospora cayetanensis]
MSFNLAQQSFLHAVLHGLDKIVIVGFLEAPCFLASVQHSVNFWSRNSCTIIFCRLSCFLGALGAALQGEGAVETSEAPDEASETLPQMYAGVGGGGPPGAPRGTAPFSPATPTAFLPLGTNKNNHFKEPQAPPLWLPPRPPMLPAPPPFRAPGWGPLSPATIDAFRGRAAISQAAL